MGLPVEFWWAERCTPEGMLGLWLSTFAAASRLHRLGKGECIVHEVP